MKITVVTLPIELIKNRQAGDWIWNGDDLEIIVVEGLDWRETMLVAIHEQMEAAKCRHDGVSEKEVDEFDAAYESQRLPGDVSESGDHGLAPYRRQHLFATGHEMILAAGLDVNWKSYESDIDHKTSL
jgi:hypothetical protein